MNKLSLSSLAKLNLNKYEAIIIASQHARNLNNKRIKTLEKMEENPELELEARKITMVALGDLLEGRLKFTRPDSM